MFLKRFQTESASAQIKLASPGGSLFHEMTIEIFRLQFDARWLLIDAYPLLWLAKFVHRIILMTAVVSKRAHCTCKEVNNASIACHRRDTTCSAP